MAQSVRKVTKKNIDTQTKKAFGMYLKNKQPANLQTA